MMARLDAMVLGEVVTMKLAGIVDAILDHGGPIVTNLRILS
jgi:hypothetical protein